MAEVFESNNFGDLVIPPHSAGEVYVMDDTVELPDDLGAGDIAKMGYLPAGCVPIDVIAVADELDGNATDTLRFSVGLLNEAGTDLVAAKTFIAGAEADTAPTVTRASGAGMLAQAPDDDDNQILAIKITAAAATGAAGGIRAIMTYRASNYGA